jgi:hypothetical protein
MIVFSTYVPIHGDYGLSVDEYVISGGKFKAVKTTFDCQCSGNVSASPFYKVLLTEGTGCQIDYSVSPAKVSHFSLALLHLSPYTTPPPTPYFP